MFPFDRLIRDMDRWTDAAGTEEEVFAQIGEGNYVPQHMRYVRRLSQPEFAATMAQAEMIVAHAGMGTVITAGRLGRPLVLLPRRYELGEHTTDHQIATANWLRGKPGIFVAEDGADLPSRIAEARAADLSGSSRLSPVADPAFTDRIRAAILGFLD